MKTNKRNVMLNRDLVTLGNLFSAHVRKHDINTFKFFHLLQTILRRKPLLRLKFNHLLATHVWLLQWADRKAKHQGCRSHWLTQINSLTHFCNDCVSNYVRHDQKHFCTVSYW